MSSSLDYYKDRSLGKKKKKKHSKDKDRKKEQTKNYMGKGLKIVDDLDSFPLPFPTSGEKTTKYRAKKVSDLPRPDSDDEADELPQIAGVVDERPIELQAKERFGGGKWRTLGEEEEEKSKPPRKRHNSPSSSPPRKRRNSPTNSPPRKRRNSPSISPPRKRRSSPSNSPPRKRRSSPANSPPRKRRSPPSNSPPRRSRDNKHKSPTNSPPRKRRSSPTNPPPRKRRNSPSNSPPRRSRNHKHKSPSNSPPRHSRHNKHRSPSISPPRHIRIKKEKSPSNSPPRHSRHRKHKSPSISPPRHSRIKKEKSPSNSPPRRRQRNSPTPPPTATDDGRHATTIYRDRKTGKIRDFHAERLDKSEKQRKEDEKREQYDKWGKGLKQVEEQKTRLDDAVHEMSKPLARYKDDTDLDELLKNQERDGDPMLKFLSKKKKGGSAIGGGPSKPMYVGPAPAPNRFGILPGHKWDGVDRSNGYEKEWFSKINTRKAGVEEAYKWSVEDM